MKTSKITKVEVFGDNMDSKLSEQKKNEIKIEEPDQSLPVIKILKELEDAENNLKKIKAEIQTKEEMAIQVKADNECVLTSQNPDVEKVERQKENVEQDIQKLKDRSVEIEREVAELTFEINENTKRHCDLVNQMKKCKNWNILVNNICFFSVSGYLLSFAFNN